MGIWISSERKPFLIKDDRKRSKSKDSVSTLNLIKLHLFYNHSIHRQTAIFLAKFCPRVKGPMRVALCEALTREKRPDHNNGTYMPCSLQQVCGFLNVPYKPSNTEHAGDGAYDLQPLSEKKKKSNQIVFFSKVSVINVYMYFLQ